MNSCGNLVEGHIKHPLFAQLGPAELASHLTVVEHIYSITVEQLFELGGVPDKSPSATGLIGNQGIDVMLGTDIDAAHRVVHQNDRRTGPQGSGEQHFLLVATRQGKDRQITPIIIGKKEGAYAASFETCAFPNLDYEIERFLGPGEIISIDYEGLEQLRKPNEKMQICSFLWVYYGYPPSFYEGLNVDECRYKCGAALAKNDNIAADFVAGIPDLISFVL